MFYRFFLFILTLFSLGSSFQVFSASGIKPSNLSLEECIEETAGSHKPHVDESILTAELESPGWEYYAELSPSAVPSPDCPPTPPTPATPGIQKKLSASINRVRSGSVNSVRGLLNDISENSDSDDSPTRVGVEMSLSKCLLLEKVSEIIKTENLFARTIQKRFKTLVSFFGVGSSSSIEQLTAEDRFAVKEIYSTSKTVFEELFEALSELSEEARAVKLLKSLEKSDSSADSTSDEIFLVLKQKFKTLKEELLVYQESYRSIADEREQLQRKAKRFKEDFFRTHIESSYRIFCTSGGNRGVNLGSEPVRFPPQLQEWYDKLDLRQSVIVNGVRYTKSDSGTTPSSLHVFIPLKVRKKFRIPSHIKSFIWHVHSKKETA